MQANAITESHLSDGALFDDFLRGEGIYVEVTRVAAARVMAWQNGLEIAAFLPNSDSSNVGDPNL